MTVSMAIDALTACALGFAMIGLGLSLVALRSALRDYYQPDIHADADLRRVAVYAVRKNFCLIVSQGCAAVAIVIGWLMVRGMIGSDAALLSRQSLAVVVTAALACWSVLDLRYRDRP